MQTRPSAADHGLTAPSEAELLDGLARWKGAQEAEALWNRVCAFEGLRRPVRDPRALVAGAERALVETDGLARMAARTFIIKARSHALLTKGEGA